MPALPLTHAALRQRSRLPRPRKFHCRRPMSGATIDDGDTEHCCGGAPPISLGRDQVFAQRSAMPLRQVSLDDKYDLAQERVFVTGYQALVRLCLMQKERDRRAGLNTAGYVTGYRGSPLGGLDQQFL